MRSRRGRALVAAVVLVVVLVTVSLVLVAIVAPVLVVLELAVIALIAGVASRHRQPSRRPRTRGSRPRGQGGTPKPGHNAGTRSSGPQWVMQWESLPPASAVPFVRDRLARVLADWGLTTEGGGPTQLVVTELVSNAMEHARAPIQLTVSFPGTCMRVEVHDAATEPPRQQPQDPWEARGRGLQLIDAVSSRWGWTTDAAGKTVWADVSIGWPS
jgi:anti-sigma regulatory factor (Ser/Thr protein kinase)